MANGQMHDLFQLARASNLDEQVGRPADPEGRQRRERDVGADPVFPEEGAQLDGQCGETRRLRL